MKTDILNTTFLLNAIISTLLKGFTTQIVYKLIFILGIRFISGCLKLYITLIFYMMMVATSDTLEDLFCFYLILYISPAILDLKLKCIPKFSLIICIVWLVIAGFFQKGQLELLGIVIVLALAIRDMIKDKEIQKLNEMNRGITMDRDEIQERFRYLETKLLSADKNRSPITGKRTTVILDKLKKLNSQNALSKYAFCRKIQRENSLNSFEEEQLAIPTLRASDSNINLLRTKRRGSSSSSSTELDIGITHEEINEIISSLIDQEYLMWNPAKGAAAELDLASIGMNAIHVYTQSVDSLPGVTEKVLSIDPMQDRRNTATMYSLCNDSQTLLEALRTIGIWDFDTLRVIQAINNPAFEVGRYIFDFLDLINSMDLDTHLLNRFLTVVEEGYHKENFYHNSIHAADVAASIVFLIRDGLAVSGKILDIDVFSLVIAALCHDIGHPGVNNGFLVATQDPLAIKYNDQSILENMHANKTFQILSNASTNVVKGLSKPDYQRFRKIVVLAILATDLQVHFDKLAEFKTQVANKMTLNDDKFKLMSLQICLKCADIGHGAKTLELHKKWTSLITKEFFRQGDMERNRGIPVTPLCDRVNVIVSKSQEGFLKVLVKPLFELWEEFVEQNTSAEKKKEGLGIKICMRNIIRNIEYWDNEYSLYKEGRHTYFLDKLPPPLYIEEE